MLLLPFTILGGIILKFVSTLNSFGLVGFIVGYKVCPYSIPV